MCSFVQICICIYMCHESIFINAKYIHRFVVYPLIKLYPVLAISYYNNPYENGWYDPLNPTNRNVDHWLVNSDPYHSLSLSLLMAYYN